MVEGCRFDPTGVEVSHNQAVTFGPAKSVGEYFVRDAIEGVVEVLVAETTAFHASSLRAFQRLNLPMGVVTGPTPGTVGGQIALTGLPSRTNLPSADLCCGHRSGSTDDLPE